MKTTLPDLGNQKISIFWFRRDLRLADNAGLHRALNSGTPVLPIFIFDADILDSLPDRRDRRVAFIHDALEEIQQQLTAIGSSLLILHGKVADIWALLQSTYQIDAVYANHDYEPYARQRDTQIATLLKSSGIMYQTDKDQVVFEKDEVLTAQGKPYTVYTPYRNSWRSRLESKDLGEYDTSPFFDAFVKCAPLPGPSLSELGFQAVGDIFPSRELREEIIKKYDQQRDFPAVAGTSRLSVHLRFGTISTRDLVRRALQINEIWLNELVWREFFMMILWHFPHVVDQPFKEKYAAIPWRDSETDFQRWCDGQTGYPIVDAGMRELNETGFMHNRVRMVTASFLTKHLLIDWRAGERYFAAKLLDYDLSANNGNWQWAAGCGCDAAPYFRIFNPYTQRDKFDPQSEYTRRWVPELDTAAYPPPIVDHKYARQRTLTVYKAALQNS